MEFVRRPRRLTVAELEKIKPKLLNANIDLIRQGEELKKKYRAEVESNKRTAKTLTLIEQFEESVQNFEGVSTTPSIA